MANEEDQFWDHTKILLGKNLKLKRQQYLIPTRMFKVPLPLAATVEFVLPLAIIILLTYIKTLTDIDVFPKVTTQAPPTQQIPRDISERFLVVTGLGRGRAAGNPLRGHGVRERS